MERFIITGQKQLRGTVEVSGAKNVSLKALVAACLTDEEVIIHNVPHISDLFVMIEIMEFLGGKVIMEDHTVHVQMKEVYSKKIPLDKAARIRTSAMFIAPLLARLGNAVIPDPGGDRIGARPIDRTIKGLQKMNVEIFYDSEDGYFYAKTNKLRAVDYTFSKNTHTGTETLILACVLADGVSILKNAAEEPEIDELIRMLNSMGARIQRIENREIIITGVKKLGGTEFTICPDRNEVVTFAIAAAATMGDITVLGAASVDIKDFLLKFKEAGCGYEIMDSNIHFFYTGRLKSTNVRISIFPGFMTDWQAPWAVLMTQAQGISSIHETVFEYRFGYVKELQRMGARIECYDPEVKNPDRIYNFNLADGKPNHVRAIRIFGHAALHNAVVTMPDLRAGATLVLAALIAEGTSTIFGVEQLDRGYENFEKRLRLLGANIQRVKAEI